MEIFFKGSEVAAFVLTISLAVVGYGGEIVVVARDPEKGSSTRLLLIATACFLSWCAARASDLLVVATNGTGAVMTVSVLATRYITPHIRSRTLKK